ncbi:MAG: hypothetical protein Q8R13_06385 [bacterium]|nr:hypothetical protein [bacterium]MDZ4296416.1 hypothetical protein [Patescibacteria group bacterium]
MDFISKLVLTGVILMLFFAAGRLVYRHVIVPWSVQDERQQCLVQAERQPTSALVQEARERCARTYPDFL